MKNRFDNKGLVRLLVYLAVIFLFIAVVLILFKDSVDRPSVTKIICWDGSIVENVSQCPVEQSINTSCESDSECSIGAKGACCKGEICRALVKVEPCDGCIPQVSCKCIEGRCDFVPNCDVCVGCVPGNKTCPDGTTVTRVMPECDFQKCPENA